MQAVTGRGELIKSGGRVVKNVTGYDLCKLLTGSFGTLAALSEVTFKVLPAPPETATLLLAGLARDAGFAALRRALGSAYDVAGAAYLPARRGGRLDGSPRSRPRAPTSPCSGSRVWRLRCATAPRR